MGFFYNTYREWWEGVKVGILWFPSKANLWSAIERSLSHYKKQCETSWDAIQAVHIFTFGFSVFTWLAGDDFQFLALMLMHLI